MHRKKKLNFLQKLIINTKTDFFSKNPILITVLQQKLKSLLSDSKISIQFYLKKAYGNVLHM